ncbi:MAG: transporter [Burkholderiaceae bacterium]|nr:transporter [Burkholderiaceae bacterium]
MDVVTPTYGGDEAGMICGYHFTPGRAPEPLGAAQAVAWLQAQALAAPGDRLAGDFLWLHMNLSHASAERWLLQHARLCDEFFEALRDDVRSTRIERANDALVAVVNDLSFDFSFDASDIATLWVSVTDALVVTARREPLRSVDQLRKAVKGGAPLRSTAELLEHLLRDQADLLVNVVRKTTMRVDRIEDQLLTGRLNTQRASLGTLRRLLVRLQRLLAPEPAALFRLLQHPPAWVTEHDLQELRQATEEFSMVLQDMVSLQERIKLLQEEVATMVNEQNNRSLFVLTIVTVLALPINMIAGLLGMNVGGIPLAEDPYGFWIIVAIVLTFTALAGWWAFRRQRDND